MRLQLNSLKDIDLLAKKIAGTLSAGSVLALTGPLGAGKTTFTRLLAKRLGVKRAVKSPSFTIIQTYAINSPPAADQLSLKLKNNAVKKGKIKKAKVKVKNQKLTFCHIDAYRLKDTSELEALGFYDYLNDPNTIMVIEWADNIKKAIPPKAKWLKFKLNKNQKNN